MKISRKQLKQLIEQVVFENDDPFAQKLAVHAKTSYEIADKLKAQVFAAKQIAEKAQHYDRAYENKLKQYNDMLDKLYEFMRFLKKG